MAIFGKLGSLGGIGDAIGDLVDGLSKGMGAADPDGKIAAAQAQITGLRQQETAMLAEIGRQAFAANPLGYEQGEDLRRLQAEIAAATERLTALQQEEEHARLARENAKASADAAIHCPACGCQNREGTRFCQECGAKLDRAFCVACGGALTPGARFCGACGAKQAE